MQKRWVGLLAVPLVLAGCGGSSGSPAAAGSAKPSGEIKVLTNRTDIVDTDLKAYAATFEKKFPGVTVKFEAITDYEGEVKIRMNTDNYGDVLLIPRAVKKSDYPTFFEPLGNASDLSKQYNWTDFTTVGDKAYGIATFGNANGFVYNKKVWSAAGVTQDPTTPAEFLSDLKAIKAKTNATPYYTNYHDGWPVSSWQGAFGSASCDQQANDALATDKAPWTSGKDLATIDGLLYDTVNAQLVEPDPTTTNWETSKTLLGTGKVATMWLGSWAVSQMQDAATKAGGRAGDIGFMPFPMQKDGKFCSVTGPDYNQAINVHSKNKVAARAWLDWFTSSSGFAQKQGGIPAAKGAALPATLADYDKIGVSYIELKQDKAADVDNVDNASEVGLNVPGYRQHLVDVARGAAGGDKASVFSDLNKKWAEGISTAGI
jgi:ABC-type glycerol-3-phosphate transport system substrate-binding protein